MKKNKAEMTPKLSSFFAEYIPVVESYMREYMQSIKQYPQPVYEAMEYSLFAGGKRLRPLLVIAGCRLFCEDIHSILPIASAMEFIHTYSLIHDDLPAMDDDDLRRGRPTLHKKYSEYMAILAGDGLLNLAFEILSDPEQMNAMDPAVRLAVIRMISQSSGVQGMVGGQVADVMSEKEKMDVDLPMLEFIHIHKTGALIKAAVMSGALASGKASDEELDALEKYARNLGLLFQVVDDILDIVGDPEALGKPVHHDTVKQIYPRLIGLEASRELASELFRKACDSVAVFGDRAEILVDLCDFCQRRTF